MTLEVSARSIDGDPAQNVAVIGVDVLEEDEAVAGCPVCSGDAFSMGCLGWTRHYRCGDCGTAFSMEVERA